jgi:hypothetical protein
MMKILTAAGTATEVRREAARNLATLNDAVTLGTTVWTGSVQKADGPNPSVARFSTPTVAEATLQSLDREMNEITHKEEAWRKAGREQQNPDTATEFVLGEETFYAPAERREAVVICADTLALLGDRRIAADLVLRAAATEDPLIRATWARAADELGDSTAVLSLKDRLVADTLDAPAGSDRQAWRAVFGCLAVSKHPAAILGLRAILKKGHRWHDSAVNEMLAGSSDSFGSDDSLRSHPWCLELLAVLLDDTQETGEVITLERDEASGGWRQASKTHHGGSSSNAEPRLADESRYDRTWKTRRCDQAAALLGELLGDHAEDGFHPLAKDRDKKITELNQFLRIHQGTFRDFAGHLDGGTGWAVSGGRFLPVFPPMDHAATAADVAAGRARFALEAAGPPPLIRTPLVTEWYGRKPSGHVFSQDPNAVFGREVVVMQVERDSKGALWFGIADGNGFFVVPSAEIGALETLDCPE